MKLNDISGQIIDSAIRIHTVLGPGLLESAYQACLSHELRKRGLAVEEHVQIGIRYEGVVLDIGYRIDLRVESLVIVELKAVSRVQPLHLAQLLSYLRLGDCPLGLLLNFHEPLMKNGITRLINRRASYFSAEARLAPRLQKRRPIAH
jgi:GxxExxY protein